ncbi:MAG: hypothetical protein IGS49_14520 [Chlorogloeopsis fritschii C42_A2020_084]|uniref:hypothetical protein n=1 Tax=Chlorogloeopsis fritschii TaxID=1124 RepID=UPI0019DA6C77|nr:hypothetical protein [Chlorogloeopsis fritschii]MBF2006640.1 hypothetical protein [Chlorogloeopsis fritschii C42_A2020_084]
MSQDNQNPQPSSSPEPEENRLRQRQYQKAQPFWKAKTIQILRGAIALLETTVEKLETEPPGGTEETSSVLQPLQSGWSGLLAKIRSLLPANLSANLSDTVLTGVIAVTTVILIWTTSNIFTSKPTEVATAPPASPTQETPPVEEVPSPTITTPPESLPTPTPSPPAEEEAAPPTEEITPPPTSEPEPEVTPTPTPTPTPTLVLTPEQTLIAAIENQVAQVSDRIASGLIQSIQANFLTSTLTMKISDDWYTLKESQQNKLAAEILQRSQELDFTHLEITDSQNRLVARSPVVGNEMVIFKRR